MMNYLELGASASTLCALVYSSASGAGLRVIDNSSVPKEKEIAISTVWLERLISMFNKLDECPLGCGFICRDVAASVSIVKQFEDRYCLQVNRLLAEYHLTKHQIEELEINLNKFLSNLRRK